jgi:hypothetical protein
MIVPRFQRITLSLVLLAASPVAAVTVWSIRHTAIELSDPCANWNTPPEQAAFSHLGVHDPCRTFKVHTESKTRAGIIAAIVPGGCLLSAMLAVAGAALSRRRVVLAAGIGMLAETLVVFSIAPLTLLAGVSFLLLSRRSLPSS